MAPRTFKLKTWWRCRKCRQEIPGIKKGREDKAMRRSQKAHESQCHWQCEWCREIFKGVKQARGFDVEFKTTHKRTACYKRAKQRCHTCLVLITARGSEGDRNGRKALVAALKAHDETCPGRGQLPNEAQPTLPTAATDAEPPLPQPPSEDPTKVPVTRKSRGVYHCTRCQKDIPDITMYGQGDDNATRKAIRAHQRQCHWKCNRCDQIIYGVQQRLRHDDPKKLKHLSENCYRLIKEKCDACQHVVIAYESDSDRHGEEALQLAWEEHQKKCPKKEVHAGGCGGEPADRKHPPWRSDLPSKVLNAATRFPTAPGLLPGLIHSLTAPKQVLLVDFEWLHIGSPAPFYPVGVAENRMTPLPIQIAVASATGEWIVPPTVINYGVTVGDLYQHCVNSVAENPRKIKGAHKTISRIYHTADATWTLQSKTHGMCWKEYGDRIEAYADKHGVPVAFYSWGTTNTDLVMLKNGLSTVGKDHLIPHTPIRKQPLWWWRELRDHLGIETAGMDLSQSYVYRSLYWDNKTLWANAHDAGADVNMMMRLMFVYFCQYLGIPIPGKTRYDSSGFETAKWPLNKDTGLPRLDQLDVDSLVFSANDQRRVFTEMLEKARKGHHVVEEDHGALDDDELEPEFESDEGSEDEGSEDEGSEDEGSEDEGSEDEGSEDEGSEDEGSEDEGSEDEGSEDEGSEGEGSEDEGSEDEGSEGEGSEDEGSEGEGSEDEGSEDEGSEGEGSEDEGGEDEGSEDDE
ncbi:hypothetical protein B0T21DRAFT_408523 [Apiosordaria backusii]|uniref:Uncharacterized protein n=1 Tax=Apiosordaria backusii TaxID=314023 RepID=A0AA40ELV7_9PEZI|nr:hypothetical protein B0T21DRAFT_408523 [Apiosordaria backusii]